MSDLLQGVPIPNLDPKAVAVASARVRRICGWHIAPLVTETIVLPWSHTGRYLLPSMRVTAVASVTVAGAPVIFDWSSGGNLWITPLAIPPLFGGSLRRIAVSVTHGYDQCPDEVRDVVAQMARQVGSRQLRSKTSGPFTESYEPDQFTSSLDAYCLPLVA